VKGTQNGKRPPTKGVGLKGGILLWEGIKGGKALSGKEGKAEKYHKPLDREIP